ncbi:MAG TPA: protein kinase [Terriglobales bacterium]|nr:protein kinase [Terriglobales bacterium]
MVGTTLWSYRIESKIGAGGMGVVYKAVDSRLDRPVAIKVLPASALASADRQRRFVQEAKTASSLNHPNIVTIYDINTQEVDGQPVQYIAMEFVAGETLDKLIGRKGLKVRESLKYAIQIADALSAAHAAGVVHRDLKPSNVMVTPQGLVKILDFGLAKITGPLDTDAYAETLHAEASPHTEEGTVLGTVAFMSPEQADGRKIDARSDIFSFGSVLYEMITGHQAFPGASKLSTLSSVLYKDPQPVSQAVPDVHPELDRIISRCLKKDPERRWQTMADVKVALEELRDELDVSGAVPIQPRTYVARPAPRHTGRWIAIGALAGIILAIATAAYFAPRLMRTEPPSFQRLTFRRGDVTSANFAPGGAIVYSAEWDGGPSTFYSVMPGNREGRQLQLPPGRLTSVSASGEMAVVLGNGDSGTLARVPFGGGAPREILENVFYADWGPDGESMAVVRNVGGKFRLEYPTGTVLYQTEGRPPAFPRVSPDGKIVAFLEYDDEVGDYSLCVVGPNHPKQTLSRGWRGTGRLGWSMSGKEVWFSGAQAGADPALYAVDLSGKQRFISQVPGWIIMQDVARDGRVLINAVNSRLGILYAANGGSPRDLAWFDASFAYDLSQDAKSLVFVELSSGEGRNAAIYLRKTDGSPAVRLGYGNRPALSPDGKWVAIIQRHPARSQLILLPTGPGELRTLDVEDMHYESVEWFPDGKRILFTGNQPGHPVRSWMYELEGGGKPRPVTQEGIRGTRVSPDGHSFVVVDPRKLRLGDVGGGEPRTITELQPGESAVRWSADGRYLFLAQQLGETLKLSRVEIASRKSEPWRTLKVPEGGAAFFGPVALSADGKAVACTFQHDLANLYLVKGLK